MIVTSSGKEDFVDVIKVPSKLTLGREIIGISLTFKLVLEVRQSMRRNFWERATWQG